MTSTTNPRHLRRLDLVDRIAHAGGPWPAYAFTDYGREFLVVTGHAVDNLRPGALPEHRDRARWFVVDSMTGELSGPGSDGYALLRDVRDHVAAVREDQRAGRGGGWWIARARTATCPECSRVFNLTNAGDAAEWHAGHDCEVEA